MKKKLLSLLLALALVLSNTTVAFAAESLNQPTEMANAIPTATGAEAVAAASASDSVVIDLRAAADYEAAHIKGSISLPVCLSDYSVTTDQRDNFVSYVKENISSDTKIYLVCYMGTFCVDFAAKWLTDPVDANGCGFATTNLYRVTGGVWQDADLAAACKFTSSSYALAADGIILDVRATEVYYEKGYIDGSLHQPLFNRVNGSNVVTDRTDALAQNFNAFIEANRTLLESKNIYILCNGGASGAAAATYLLAQAGISDNVYTIEGGANALYATEGLFTNQQFVSGADTIAAMDDPSVLIIDVRAAERYVAGHLTGVDSYPLFTVDANDKNVVTSGSDALAQNFLAKVAANADLFAGKDIYVLCNGGASGAKAATKLLMQAGYSNANIFTITNGAKDENIKNNFVKEQVTYDTVLACDGIILDVRASEVYYEKGYIDGSLHQPLFNRVNGSNVVTDRTDALAQNFNAFIAANRSLLESKNIFILCNGGASGAAAATYLLEQAGIKDNVYTIKGGANALYGTDGIFTNQQYVSGADTIAAMNDPGVLIIDVRATERYNAGHLKGVDSYPLFTVDANDKNVVTSGFDTLAQNFLAKVAANVSLFAGKDIYVLCNGGASGAKAATKLLMQAGYSNANIFTITNGAKDENIKNNFVTDAAEWIQDENGWWYKETDGSWPASAWKLIDGEWFYFNAKGYRVTGWQKVNNVWYFFDEETGVMAANSWIGDYYVSASGAMVTGWVQLDEEWYFFDATGKKTTGWVLSKSGWFYLDTESGVMVTDSWIGDYYVDATGVMRTGWLELDGTWYYLGTTGKKAVDWQKIKGVWYFFDEDGAMLEEGLYDIDGTTYAFNASGAMLTGWQKIEDEWYYFDASGAGYTGWIKSGANWYFCEDGWMVYDCTYYIEKEDKWAEFTADGVWLYYVQWAE